MKKKLLVSIIFLAFLILNVIGFIGYHALSKQTPKAEAVIYWFYKMAECDSYCGGAPLEIWEKCMHHCIFAE
jgi:hypothetical protein